MPQQREAAFPHQDLKLTRSILQKSRSERRATRLLPTTRYTRAGMPKPAAYSDVLIRMPRVPRKSRAHLSLEEMALKPPPHLARGSITADAGLRRVSTRRSRRNIVYNSRWCFSRPWIWLRPHGAIYGANPAWTMPMRDPTISVPISASNPDGIDLFRRSSIGPARFTEIILVDLMRSNQEQIEAGVSFV